MNCPGTNQQRLNENKMISVCLTKDQKVGKIKGLNEIKMIGVPIYGLMTFKIVGPFGFFAPSPR